MKLMKWVRCALSCLMMCGSVSAMVFDNRFLPLIPQPFFANKDAIWDYGVRGIFFGSKKTLNPDIASLQGDEIPLYNLFGTYDEVVLENALRQAQLITGSLFPPDLLGVNSIVWRQKGKISFQGVVFETFLHLTSYLGIGGSLIGGKMDAHLELSRVRDSAQFTPGDEQALINVNTQIHEILNLQPPCYDHGAFGDIDLYLRFHGVREYWNKFRRIDLGFNFGFLIPTGQKNKINNPAFIPLGNPHFGLYGAFDGTFVLKDEFIVGLLLRCNKRFAATECVRMPVLIPLGQLPAQELPHEPLNYGALVGPARITPGWTLIFSPRFQWMGLRQGLGFNLAYILTNHWQDKIRDLRTPAQIAESAPANICAMEEISSWGSDYFSIAALYDFGYDKDCARFAPIVSLIFDIPFKGLVAKRVAKTHGISLRIESRI